MRCDDPILVTGAGGKLGQLLYRAAQQKQLTDRFIWQSRTGQNGRAGRWVQDDLSAPELLLSRIPKIGGILHLAGVTSVRATLDDMHQANVSLAMRMVQASQGLRLFLLSSAGVYGRPGPSQPAFREVDHLNPLSPYAKSKFTMERAALAAGTSGVCILRLGNVAGADAVVGQMIGDRATHSLSLDQFDKGRGPQRSYIGPGALLDVLYTLCHLTAPLPPVLNIATPVPVTMDALLDAWATRYPGEGRYKLRPAKPTALPRVALDTSLLQKMFTFAPDASEPAQIVQDLAECLDRQPC